MRTISLFAILVFFYSCANNLTDAEFELRQYEEQERVIAYRLWRDACLRSGGSIFMNNPLRPCRKHGECIPDRVDWSQYCRNNRTLCVKWR